MEDKPASSVLPPEPKSVEPSVKQPNVNPVVEPNPAESFTPTPLTDTTTPEPAKPKKRGLKALMIAVIAVAVVGAGTFAYFGVVVPNQPENVVKAALANLLSASSANARGSAQMNWSNFSVNPVFNVEIAEDKSAALGVKANLGGADLSLDVKQIADDAYLKLSGLSGLGDSWQDALVAYGFSDQQVSTVDDLVTSIEDKWIVINNVAQSTQDGLPNIDAAQISTAFGEREIITSAEKIGEETIESRAASHFKVTFNKDEIKAGIDALNVENLDEEKKNQLKTTLDELNLSDIDLWVYDDTKEFAKFTHAGNFSDNPDNGSYEAEVVFINFNQSVSVEAPTDTVSGAELWLDLNNSLQLDQLYQETFQGIPTDPIEDI